MTPSVDPAVLIPSLIVALRPATIADATLIRLARIDDRQVAWAPAGWPPELVQRIGAQQADALERHIAAHHPGAERLAIEDRGRLVGGLRVDRTVSPWRLLDIVVLPSARGRGVGTAAIRGVLRSATAVDLHVGIDNARAEALYRRLGFVDACGGLATHRRLLWMSGR